MCIPWEVIAGLFSRYIGGESRRNVLRVEYGKANLRDSDVVVLSVDVSGCGSLEQCEKLHVAHPGGTSIKVISRDEVLPGSLAEDEEFLEEFAGCKPESASKRLREYLPFVKTIYVFQILDGAYQGRGWDVVHALEGVIWSTVGGIMQADNEAFSNETIGLASQL